MNAVAKSLPMNAERVRYDRERAQAWLSGHLWRTTGVDVQAGVTTPAEREVRIRRVLADRGLADQVMGRFNGREETYRQFVRRAIGIELEADAR
jgi:hypothetical protein